jgi:flagellar motility protein MotE (MotC chaperone)
MKFLSFEFRVPGLQALRLLALPAAYCLILTAPAFSASPTEIGGNAAQKAEEGREESLVQFLEKKKKEMDNRESELNDREARLDLLSKEIEMKISELSKLREKIEGYLKKLNAIDVKKTEHLIKIYESMPPKEAAARVEQLDNDTAILVLSGMKQRTAGKVMSFIEPGKAAELSKGLVKRFK